MAGHRADCLQATDLVTSNTVFNQMTGLVETLKIVIKAVTQGFLLGRKMWHSAVTMQGAPVVFPVSE